MIAGMEIENRLCVPDHASFFKRWFAVTLR